MQNVPAAMPEEGEANFEADAAPLPEHAMPEAPAADVPMAQEEHPQQAEAVVARETGAWTAERVDQVANHMDRWFQPRPEEASSSTAQRSLKRRTSEEGGAAPCTSDGTQRRQS